MAAPASAVSVAGLGGAVRAPRSGGNQRRRRGVEVHSPSLLFGRNNGPCFPRNDPRHLALAHSLPLWLIPSSSSLARRASRFDQLCQTWAMSRSYFAGVVVHLGAVRVGGSGRRVAMRAAGASGWVMVPEGGSDGMPSSAGAAQFESDDLQVRDISCPQNTGTTTFAWFAGNTCLVLSNEMRYRRTAGFHTYVALRPLSCLNVCAIASARVDFCFVQVFSSC